MNVLEKIKTEYMLYEIEATPNCNDETKEVLNKFIDDMNETISSASRAINENIRDEQISKIKNFFLGAFGYEEDIDHYSSDIGIILRQSCLADRYKNYFSTMKDVVNENNYVDMCKLAMFTYDNYTDNYRYLESLRDGIHYEISGITYCSSNEETQGEFSEFFETTFPIVKGSNKLFKK